MTKPRTRFAPSPSGFLHLGGARTALFNWAFARRHGGEFLLRIEDTDRERSTAEAEEALQSGLQWLGIEWDGGVPRQSERAERHNEVIEELLAKGVAYRCACTPDELEERRQKTLAAGDSWVYDGRCRERNLAADCGPHCVRLRVPEDGKLDWDDLIYGPSGQNASEIGDRVIRRTGGGPIYHLAVVVDDLDMGITHVIRGADHHSNTPLQIAIYRALDRTPPLFAHVPLIVNASGKKLSKRHDNVSIQSFEQEGYLADAVRNWLVRIGWSHGDQEIFTREEIASLFDLDSVGRSSGQADQAKLVALNQHYLKTYPQDLLLAALDPFLEKTAEALPNRSEELAQLVDLLRERSKTLADMAEQARWLLVEDVEPDPDAARKHLKPAARPILAALHERLSAVADWDEPALETVFESVRADQGDIGMGKLAQPVRVAVTGGPKSPGIYQTLAVLGKQRSLDRIARALELINETEAS